MDHGRSTISSFIETSLSVPEHGLPLVDYFTVGAMLGIGDGFSLNNNDQSRVANDTEIGKLR
jgi:hypothetical protein